MLSSVEQAFVGREEKRAPLKTPAWEATLNQEPIKLNAMINLCHMVKFRTSEARTNGK